MICKRMSSNYSDSGEWIPEVRCWCGEIAPVRMSWSYANPGKRFRACPRYGVRGNGNCRYFQWLDSDVSDRVAKVIRGLLKRLDKQDSEMQRLQAVIEEKNVKLKKNSKNMPPHCGKWTKVTGRVQAMIIIPMYERPDAVENFEVEKNISCVNPDPKLPPAPVSPEMMPNDRREMKGMMPKVAPQAA
nr:DNA-(apurinic or apyrimidinic site) lyase [Ipomoea batatas]